MPLADATLHKLLQRGERARVSGSTRTIRESFKETDSPYWDLPLDLRDALHARLGAAAAAGAVALEWSRRGGDDRPLDAVRLVSVDHLAAFLGCATHTALLAAAEAALIARAEAFPRVRDLLDAWAALKTPRGLGPDAAPDFVDALRVLEATATPDQDVIVRVLSVALFRDSKRIEALVRHLDILTAESLGAPARDGHEVFSGIGLAKEPQPMLLAGAGEIAVRGGARTRIVAPYVGLAHHAVEAYAGTPRWVLTIENLTTFHQAAQILDGDPRGLILYTGGMPSPRWCAAYARVLAGVDAAVPVYHWGDIDQGGFRIAARIRRAVAMARAFHPWLMDAGELNMPIERASDSVHRAMATAARQAGWDDLAERMVAATCEQEGIAVRLPDQPAKR